VTQVDDEALARLAQLRAELHLEHRRLDERLLLLQRRHTPTPTEQAEMARLKKQKLLMKDRIARLV
jgi:uncharacterized protein YdcH (DUF465 family)